MTFGSLPSGTSRIIITFHKTTYSTTSANLQLLLGDSGGIETSGYDGMMTNGGTVQAHSSFWYLNEYVSSSQTYSGTITLSKTDSGGLRWAMEGQVCRQGTNHHYFGGGKALSAELTQVQIKVSSGTINGGNINIAYD